MVARGTCWQHTLWSPLAPLPFAVLEASTSMRQGRQPGTTVGGGIFSTGCVGSRSIRVGSGRICQSHNLWTPDLHQGGCRWVQATWPQQQYPKGMHSGNGHTASCLCTSLSSFVKWVDDAKNTTYLAGLSFVKTGETQRVPCPGKHTCFSYCSSRSQSRTLHALNFLRRLEEIKQNFKREFKIVKWSIISLRLQGEGPNSERLTGSAAFPDLSPSLGSSPSSEAPPFSLLCFLDLLLPPTLQQPHSVPMELSPCKYLLFPQRLLP